MDQLFERLLPSASQEQVESSRWRVLERVRADVAAGRQPGEAIESAGAALNYGDYHILLVLADGERHGYAIMSEVEAVTEGATKFGPGTLYTSLCRLLEAGLIEETECRSDPIVNDEPRQHYQLTGMGQRVLRAESERLAAQVFHVRGRQVVRSL
jgi:DNA-binding PadR family transcriptional regulator